MSSSFSEIGSEFWIEHVPEHLLTERDGVYAISGRTAIDLVLQDVLKKGSMRKVYMPAWCCDSMMAPFLAHGIEVCFYDMSIETRMTTNDHELITNFSFFLTRIITNLSRISHKLIFG